MAIVAQKHRKKPGKLLKRIRAAMESGNKAKARRLTLIWLRSFEAKRLCVRLACRKMKLHLRPKNSERDVIAGRLDPWRGTGEAVYVNRRSKEHQPDDYRHVMSFGIENRSLQYLLLLVLRELMPLHPSQYGTRGHGTHEAIETVLKAINEGYRWVIEYDIEEFFPSFDWKRVPDLVPLPRKVSEKVLLGKHLTLIGGYSLSGLFGREGDDDWFPDLLNAELADARRGNPQGSAVSPFLAAALLADALYKIPELGIVVAFSDNLLLLAKSKDDAMAMSKGLWGALQAHPAGRLRPKVKRFDPGEPFDFLGHRLTPAMGKGRVDPSPRNKDKFEHRMKSRLRRLDKATLTPDQRARLIRKMEKDVCSWTRGAFKLCHSIQNFRDNWLAKIPAS